MADIRFITANPGAAGYDDMQNRLWSDQQREEIRRKREEDQAVDAALRAGITDKYAPPPAAGPALDPMAQQGLDSEMASRGIAAPAPAGASAGVSRPTGDRAIVSRLASTPGGGRLALNVDQAGQNRDQRTQDHYGQIASQALLKGDLDMFHWANSKGGLNIPEQVAGDAKTRSLVGRAMQLGHSYYGKNPAQAQKFGQAFLQSQGDIQAAWNAAGAPTDATKRHVTIQTIMDGDRRLLARYNDQGEYLGLAQGPGGAPAMADAGRPRAGTTPQGYSLNVLAQKRKDADLQAATDVLGVTGLTTPASERKPEEQAAIKARAREIYKSWTGRDYDTYDTGAPGAPLKFNTQPRAPAAPSATVPGPDGKPVTGQHTGGFTPEGYPIYKTPEGRSFALPPDEVKGGTGDGAGYDDTVDDPEAPDTESGGGVNDVWANGEEEN